MSRLHRVRALRDDVQDLGERVMRAEIFNREGCTATKPVVAAARL